jgi:hypothetical protein
MFWIDLLFLFIVTSSSFVRGTSSPSLPLCPVREGGGEGQGLFLGGFHLLKRGGGLLFQWGSAQWGQGLNWWDLKLRLLREYYKSSPVLWHEDKDEDEDGEENEET